MGALEVRTQGLQRSGVAHNYVQNGGGGAIWGTGGSRVVMFGNIIDGALDVGLDLQWCDDSVICGNLICGNTVRSCLNAGIALELVCERVAITENTIINDHPMTSEQAAQAGRVRAGIRLTEPNRGLFKADRGRRDVTIVGNTIHSAGDLTRRSM